MISKHICPFCGKEFKNGWDPETDIKYDVHRIILQRTDYSETYEYYDNGWTYSYICCECFNKIFNDIKTIERRIKNEQPKFP